MASRPVQEEVVDRLIRHLDAVQTALNEMRESSDTRTSLEASAGSRPRESAYQTAQRLFSDRRVRSSYFSDENLFGEPGWDILLDVYIHQSQDDDVSVKSACIGSGAPATTALRWLGVLEEMSLICSVSDPNDQRRRFIRLTPKGHERLTRYLESVARKR